MHKRKLTTRITVLLCTIVVLCSVLILPANAASASTIIANDGTTKTVAKMTTSSADSKVYPIYATQALHTKGISTTLNVTTTFSKQVASTSSLTAGYSAAFASLAGQLGVSNSQSYSVSAGVSYGISASQESGWYRIEVVFPGSKVNENVTKQTGDAIDTIWSNYISYAPNTNSAYYRCNRYDAP